MCTCVGIYVHVLVLGDIPVFSNVVRISKISYSIVMIIIDI